MKLTKTATGYNDNTSLIGLGLQHVVEGGIIFNNMKTPQCGIYKITNPKGRIYIGQSMDLEKRKRNYQNCDCKYQIRLCNSIKKYGWEAHTFEIIHECSKEELNKWEDHYITLYDCFDTEHGLNLRRAGSKGSLSEETKKKISESLKGRPASKKSIERLKEYNKTRVWSKESREKISKAHKGKYWGQNYERTPEWRRKASELRKGRKTKPCSEEQKAFISKLHKGKIVSEETRRKLSIAHTGRKGVPITPEHRKRLNEGRMSRPVEILEAENNRLRAYNEKKAICVCQISLDGFLLEVFPSIHAASKATGATRKHIKNVIQGKSKKHKGYIWK